VALPSGDSLLFVAGAQPLTAISTFAYSFLPLPAAAVLATT
jgi:hypothetical protein